MAYPPLVLLPQVTHKWLKWKGWTRVESEHSVLMLQDPITDEICDIKTAVYAQMARESKY